MKTHTLALSALSLALSPLLATAYSGDITYYTPAYDGSSACAIPAQHGEYVVAISQLKWAGGNPNNDPMCGTTITIYNPYNQMTIENVKIVDKCMKCLEQDIDVSPELFHALGLTDAQGRVHGMDWGGNVVGGKRSASGLEPLVITPQKEKREGRHPHARV